MELLKTIHVSCVALSFCGFFIRGIWMITGSGLLHQKWTKVFPHVVDAALLISALWLLFELQWPFFDLPWLQMKVFALLIYIALGMFALKPMFSKRLRVSAWISGLLVFLFIVSVAMSKSAAGVFANYL